MGDPLDPTTMMGAQASKDQFEKILHYIDIGKQEGAELLAGGEKFEMRFTWWILYKTTILRGHN